MTNISEILTLEFNALILYGSVLIVILFLTLAVRHFIIKRISSLAGRTETKFDDIVITAVKTPSILWCVMLSIYFSMFVLDIPAGWSSAIAKTLFVLGVLSVTLVLSGISSKMISSYAERSDAPYQLSSFTRNALNVVIFIIGGLVILSSLGLSITPLLTTLGVGGLAVALGLQETLANIFAGFYIIASKQIRVNDYIKLESGEEGYVTDINWRSTKIRMLANNMIMVPNSKLAQTIITNYYFPDKELAVLVDVGVHYDSDLKHVERVTIETATEVMKTIPGGVPDFQPFIRYKTFGDYSIGFSVIMRGKEFVDQYLVKHEFIKALHARYMQEKIVIPYPITAINYRQEGAGNAGKGTASAMH